MYTSDNAGITRLKEEDNKYEARAGGIVRQQQKKEDFCLSLLVEIHDIS